MTQRKGYVVLSIAKTVKPGWRLGKYTDLVLGRKENMGLKKKNLMYRKIRIIEDKAKLFNMEKDKKEASSNCSINKTPWNKKCDLPKTSNLGE